MRTTRDLVTAIPAYLGQLGRMADAQDIVAALSILHTMKGATSSLGLVKLSAKLAALEQQLLADGTTVPLINQLQELVSMAEDGKAWLQATIVELEASATTEPSHTVWPLPKALDRLLPLLQADDLAALEVFAELRDSLQNAMPDETFSALEEAMQGLDLEAALKLCVTLDAKADVG